MQRCVSTVRSALMEFLNYVLVNVSPDRSGAAEFVRGPAEKPRSGSRCWLGEEEGGASRVRERGPICSRGDADPSVLRVVRSGTWSAPTYATWSGFSGRAGTPR